MRNSVGHGYALFVVELLQPVKPTVCLLALWDPGVKHVQRRGRKPAERCDILWLCRPCKSAVAVSGATRGRSDLGPLLSPLSPLSSFTGLVPSPEVHADPHASNG